jgi:uncharacterized membrane protein
VLLFFSAWQARFDARIGARTEIMQETNQRLAHIEARRHPLEVWQSVVLVGMGLSAAVLAVVLGGKLPILGDPTIISHTTWAILIVVTGGLLLSFTPVRNLEEVGASRLGYTALYFMLAAIGAQADLRHVVETPAFLAAGVLWIGIHAAILLVVARLLRAPLFFYSTASMANIGGPVSAPIVAGVYHPAMAPVGLLMAVGGYILGIYGGILCAWMLSLVGG